MEELLIPRIRSVYGTLLSVHLTYILTARDAEEREQWIEALETTIVRHSQYIGGRVGWWVKLSCLHDIVCFFKQKKMKTSFIIHFTFVIQVTKLVRDLSCWCYCGKKPSYLEKKFQLGDIIYLSCQFRGVNIESHWCEARALTTERAGQLFETN